MNIQEEFSKEQIEKITAVFGKKNKLSISGKLKFGDNTYYEIMGLKKSLFSKNLYGYVYIDEKCNMIMDKSILKNIAPIAYYYELYFGNDLCMGIKRLVESDENLKKGNKNFELSESGIDMLFINGMEKAEVLKEIFHKMPELRNENNSMLNSLASDVEDLKRTDMALDNEICSRLNDKYEKAMLLNLKKVKLIKSGEDYYDEIKKMADKHLRNLFTRYNSKVRDPISALSYQINYFRMIIRTYEPVLNMNETDYLKFFRNVSKGNINKRTKKILSFDNSL